MDRFPRFNSLRWVYYAIIPPKYRLKLAIAEELNAIEKTLDKTIERVNENSKAIEAITLDITDPDCNCVPDVTVSDNGKLLVVVNGKWEAVTIPFAEGVSV